MRLYLYFMQRLYEARAERALRNYEYFVGRAEKFTSRLRQIWAGAE